MGTSTVHRSPSSPHWRVVNTLYRDPDVSPARLLAEVFRASSEPYAKQLGGPEASHCVALLLRTFGPGAESTPASHAPELSRLLATESRGAASREHWSPFYADLANRAMHRTVLSVGAPGTSPRAPESVVRLFLGHLLATCVDHVVSRDLSAHLGSKALSNAATALRLSSSLKAAARELAAAEVLNAALRAAAQNPRSRWADLVASTWEVGRAMPREPRRGRG
jgi:hypothetical protein